jgi:hypothetical protein
LVPYVVGAVKGGLKGALLGAIWGCVLGGTSAIELGPGAIGVCFISGSAGAEIGFDVGVEQGLESTFDRRHRHRMKY